MNDSRFRLINTAHVWVLDINSQKQHLDVYKELLSEDEIIKAHKFKFEKDRNTSIIARATLRILCGKYLNISPKTIAFKYGEFGKPDIDTAENLKFNISHAKDLIVFGFVKDSEIGIDVEYCKRDFDVLDIVDNYFSKKEIEAIYNIPKVLQTDAFFRGWTRKEAFIKAIAKGLSFPLNAFSVSIDNEDYSKLEETLWDLDEKYKWSIIPFKTLTNYKAAIAIQEKKATIDVFEFKLENLENYK